MPYWQGCQSGMGSRGAASGRCVQSAERPERVAGLSTRYSAGRPRAHSAGRPPEYRHPAPVADTICSMKKSILMMAMLLAVIIGSVLLIGCPGGGNASYTCENGTPVAGTASSNTEYCQKCDDGYVITSESRPTCIATATNWTAQTSDVGGWIQDVHYANDQWVAVGDSYLYKPDADTAAVRRPATIITSTTGIDTTDSDDNTVPGWTARVSGIPTDETTGGSNLRAVHYDNGLWVAVGGDIAAGMTFNKTAITTSSDGETWTAGNGASDVVGQLNAVHYATDANGNNGLWVAVGGGVAGNDATSIILTSKNGTEWKNERKPRLNELFAVHYANNLWVAVGEIGAIFTSENGTNDTSGTSSTNGMSVWTRRVRPLVVVAGAMEHSDRNLRAVHYANDLWVAVGDSGTIITSTTGIDIDNAGNAETGWTAQTSNVSGELRDIHYANGLWVAVGTNGDITTSSNGTDWTKRDSKITDSSLNAIHYENNIWVASGAGGKITTSPDGETWTAQTSNVSEVLQDIHYANNLWVAVGSGADGSSSGAITTAP